MLERAGVGIVWSVVVGRSRAAPFLRRACVRPRAGATIRSRSAAELGLLRRSLRAVAFASSRRIEHVHAHFGTNSTTIAMLCRLLGGPSFSFTVHGPEEFDKPEFLHLGEKIERAAFVVGDQRVRPEPTFSAVRLRAMVEDSASCGAASMRSFTTSSRRRRPPSRDWSCVARLHEQKGLPMLIDAAARLVDRGVTFRLTSHRRRSVAR